ncbi:MAG: homoserine O-acetyltransferase [Planctomycetota bacterium]|nr:MAG: homoserine O-acetyltransferase [Planctomycetota bacterium]
MENSDPNSVGIVERKVFSFAGEGEDALKLDSGKILKNINLAYETYGHLNDDKSNAILILHALSGDAHVAGFNNSSDDKPGWWDNIIGPGKPLDTKKYFIICSNVIGGCAGSTGPSDINSETNKPYGLDFPFVTVFDMVRAQKKLIDNFGIEQLLAVIGGSMGGMQALVWAVENSVNVKGTVVIASTSSHSAQCIAFNEVGRQAILSDKNFQSGAYYDSDVTPQEGLSVARMIGHITYLSDESMGEKFGRKIQNFDGGETKNKQGYEYDLGVDTVFQIESYLRHQGATFNKRFDANSYLVITKAIDHFDLAKRYGNLEKAFEKVNSRVLVISYSSDWLYPTYHSKKIVKSMMKVGVDVSFSEIRTEKGHDAFLLEDKYLSGYLTAFLEALPERN